jgi:hypothetical protein
VTLGYSEPQLRHRVRAEVGPFRFFELGESLSGTGPVLLLLLLLPLLLLLLLLLL